MTAQCGSPRQHCSSSGHILRLLLLESFWVVRCASEGRPYSSAAVIHRFRAALEKKGSTAAAAHARLDAVPGEPSPQLWGASVFFFFFWKWSVTMGGTMQPVVHSIKRSSGRMGQPVVTPTPRHPLCRGTIAGPCRQLREKQPRRASRA